MKRLALLLLIVATFVLPLAAHDTAVDPPLTILKRSKAGMPVIALNVHGERFEVEIAATSPRRQQGMGGRARFPKGTGMLFAHPSASPRSYWMKECLFNIDVAFLDAEGVIVAVHEMQAEPPKRATETTTKYTKRLKKYLSSRPAQYAVEFVPGTIKRLKLKVGETIALPREGLRGLTR